MREGNEARLHVEVALEEILAEPGPRELRQTIVGGRDRRERIGLQGLPLLPQSRKRIRALAPGAAAGERSLVSQRNLRRQRNKGGQVGEITRVGHSIQIER